MPAEPDITLPAATSLVERLRAVHLQMLDAVLTGDGLAAVADLAAGAAGGPVAIIVPRLGVAVASAGGDAALGMVRRYVGDQARGRVAPVPGDIVAEVPIASGDERIGGVVLLQAGRPGPGAGEVLHLPAVAALTEVAVEEAREEVEENVRGSFLEEMRERPDGLDAGDIVRRAARGGGGAAGVRSGGRRGRAGRGADVGAPPPRGRADRFRVRGRAGAAHRGRP